MRLFMLTLTFALVLLPTLLILFAPQKTMVSRAIWALIAFVSPVTTLGIVRLMPLLSNEGAEATQWARFFGLLLSGSGFILPWILFAVFLHRTDRA
jgi:hypothetical protein